MPFLPAIADRIPQMDLIPIWRETSVSSAALDTDNAAYPRRPWPSERLHHAAQISPPTFVLRRERQGSEIRPAKVLASLCSLQYRDGEIPGQSSVPHQ